jgi:hypothetical protein
VVDSDVVVVELTTAAVRAGIGPVLRLLVLTMNFGSRATIDTVQRRLTTS